MPALKAVLQSYGEAVDDDTFYDLRAQEESNLEYCSDYKRIFLRIYCDY